MKERERKECRKRELMGCEDRYRICYCPVLIVFPVSTLEREGRVEVWNYLCFDRQVSINETETKQCPYILISQVIVYS